MRLRMRWTYSWELMLYNLIWFAGPPDGCPACFVIGGRFDAHEKTVPIKNGVKWTYAKCKKDHEDYAAADTTTD